MKKVQFEILLKQFDELSEWLSRLCGYAGFIRENLEKINARIDEIDEKERNI